MNKKANEPAKQPEKNGSSGPKPVSKAATPTAPLDADAGFTLILAKGEADKLSPTASGRIFFQLGRNDEEKANYLRIIGNEGGGLHSKEWISVEKVVTTLQGMKDQPFRSTALKGCMVGRSSNNASFLAAILRSPEIGLLKASDAKPFMHVVAADFESRSKGLLTRQP